MTETKRPPSMTPRAIARREAIAKARSEGKCLDCSAETTFGKNDEYYMVHDRLWLRANPQGHGKLCIGCLEKRIGRTLRPRDFKDCPLNTSFFGKSDRLVSRLTGLTEDLVRQLKAVRARSTARAAAIKLLSD